MAGFPWFFKVFAAGVGFHFLTLLWFACTTDNTKGR